MDVLAVSPREAHFVFDAGPIARLYLPNIASRSVRSICLEFSGLVHVPSLVHADLNDGFLQLWRDDDLLPGVLAVQERVTRMHSENPSGVPILHTHDAYYVALAETLRRDSGQRVILVTNDARVWRCARILGVEVFHGNTCDLGIRRLNVGSPGKDFPEGANCRPCAYETCPSGFAVDFAALPRDLGSGVPRSQRERAARVIGTAEPPP